MTPVPSTASTSCTSTGSRGVTSRSLPGGAVTPPGTSVVTTGSRPTAAGRPPLSTASTVAPHSRPRLQPETSYIWGTRPLMSRPASSRTLAIPRFAWCMSTG